MTLLSTNEARTDTSIHPEILDQRTPEQRGVEIATGVWGPCPNKYSDGFVAYFDYDTHAVELDSFCITLNIPLPDIDRPKQVVTNGDIGKTVLLQAEVLVATGEEPYAVIYRATELPHPDLD
jgi:hypothetical protein